ncbi:MAG: dihydrolipoyl dehydrogenase [Deltaproteobacteria bacterium]|nr:dihydrolipoyl dehydrogenase [Deltaproteobacteria bacterium]
MNDPEYDLVVIGAGPGGYVAAIRAAQLGLRTACVDKRAELGGVCLNVGCIPSKVLLHSSERFEEAKEGLAAHGIRCTGVEVDLDVMMARKEKVVADLTKGIDFLLKKNKVDRIIGAASIAAPGEVTVSLADGSTSALTTRNILIATGSESSPLAGVEIDEKKIVTSTGALSLERVPEKLIVIGAGAIGLELGSVWSRLGSEVTVVEYLDHILPGMDREISRQALRVFKRQGLDFQLSQKVTGAGVGGQGVRLSVEAVAGGEAGELAADVVLLAIGRRPYTEGLGLDAVGVTLDERGFIEVDRRFETRVSGIYAIGDCIPGPMLAHKAEDEGSICAEILSGQSGHIDYDRVPGVVYTWPELASVGKTEEALSEQGVSYKVGKFPFSANSRARATGATDGFVKILAETDTDRVVGVHILGPLAGDLISEAVMAMEFGASAEDIARTCHAHPSMGEAMREAALAVGGRALHI